MTGRRRSDGIALSSSFAGGAMAMSLASYARNGLGFVLAAPGDAAVASVPQRFGAVRQSAKWLRVASSPAAAGSSLCMSSGSSESSDRLSTASLAGTAGVAAAAAAAFAAARWRSGRGDRAQPLVIRFARGGGKDFYEVLGVSRSSSERDIKQAFRKLARQYHPDVNKEPGSQERFQEIARAYEVLGDSDKRGRYDQFGEAGVSGSGAGPDMSGMNLEDILGDVFGSFFGGGGGGMGGMGGMGGRRRGQPRGPQKGSDLQSEVEFPFEVACFGGERTLQVRREEACEVCNGGGIKDGMGGSKCGTCGGNGVTVQVMQTPLGVMQTQAACPACSGSGIDPSAVCNSCRGKGTKPKVKDVTVKVPAGCAAGNQLRVRGEGDKGIKGGPPGDLYVSVNVRASPDFEREGFDIYTEKTVSIFDAILGTTMVVKTIDGEAEIRVPAGTQPETRMRIRGRGVPKLGKQGERGDHYITVKVSVPRTLNTAQKKMYEELQQTTPK